MKESIIHAMRIHRKSGKELFLLLVVAVLTLYYLTRFFTTISEWQYLRLVYPAALAVYFAVSGIVFGLSFPPLGFGIWRGASWWRNSARFVFLFWFLSALAESAYTRFLGWSSGWILNLILLCGMGILIFWAIQSGYSSNRYGKGRKQT